MRLLRALLSAFVLLYGKVIITIAKPQNNAGYYHTTILSVVFRQENSLAFKNSFSIEL